MEKLVSRNERAIFLVLCGFISLVSIVNFLAIILHKVVHPPDLNISFSGHVPPSYFPIGHLIAMFLVLVVLLSRRNYIPSLTWTIFALLPFIADFSRSYLVILHNPDIFYTLTGLNLLSTIANPFDYLVSVLLLILALWQLSIIVRRYVRIESD